MKIKVEKPSNLLAPFIKQYWAIENNIEYGQSYTQRIIPSGLMELTFYFDSLPKASENANDIGSHSIISGQLNSFYDLEISGKLNMFSVTFTPIGALMFFNLPLNEVANKNVPLEFIISDVRKIEDQLYAADSFNSQVLLIENFLNKLLQKKQNTFEFNRIKNIISVLTTNENTTILDLANYACLSRKQFERIFSTQIGLSPKQYIRVIQFQRTIYGKQLQPNLSYTQLSYEAGYYDQSHMVNNFKSLSGYSPTEFFSICTPISDYFSS